MKEFKQLMNQGKFSLFGYSYPNLPLSIQNYSDERIQIFFKRKGQKIRLSDNNRWNYYSGYQDTPWGSKDIVFFDQDAVKSLCVGFPSKSKYVMVSLKYPQYYIFILLGLFRRLLSKTITIKGLINLDNGARFSPWLLLKCREIPTNSLTLSKEIGISGFLNFLSDEEIKYIVPRFYENLPNLLKFDADLDIIVYSNHCKKVKEFLLDNPGEIPVDVYTDSGTDYHGMSYVPPSKAKMALDRAQIGPGGSLIPCKQDALDLIIYHALYHKGYVSRIKSANNLDEKQEINNKYIQVIKPLCKELQIDVGDTLEEMDFYMDKVGWKPAIDTLAKISQWNEWVRDYHMNHKMTFIPLYVLILKEGIRGSKKAELIKQKCLEEGLKLLEEKELLGNIKERAITELRGGIWNDSLSPSDDVSKFHPSVILVLWDTLGRQIGGISEVKEKLRNLVDTQKTSFIHSSDNYLESLDYINICIPHRFNFYKNEDIVLNEFNQFLVNKKTFKQKFQGLMPRIRKEFRDSILRLLSH